MPDDVVTVKLNRLAIRRRRIDRLRLAPVKVGFNLTPIGDNRFRSEPTETMKTDTYRAVATEC